MRVTSHICQLLSSANFFLLEIGVRFVALGGFAVIPWQELDKLDFISRTRDGIRRLTTQRTSPVESGLRSKLPQK